MLNIIEYNGIYGVVEYVPGTKSFQVTAISENGSVFVSGETVFDIEERFAAVCEEYIAKCKDKGVSPYIPASGDIGSITVDPELHRRILVACKLKGLSVAELVEKALERYIDTM